MIAWTGWQRLPRQHWHKITEGATYDEARWRIFWVEYPGVTREVVVLPAGEHPNDIYERLAASEVHAHHAEVDAAEDKCLERLTLEQSCKDAAAVFRGSRPRQGGAKSS